MLWSGLYSPDILTRASTQMSPGILNLAMSCQFCELPAERIVYQNELAIAFYDGYPVSQGHSLVIPKRHVVDYWGLTSTEREACHDLLEAMRNVIRQSDPLVSGFNIGLNAGTSAGQTVYHCHFHLIPRRDGDVPNPRGGVRHVIPEKGYYKSSDPPKKV